MYPVRCSSDHAHHTCTSCTGQLGASAYADCSDFLQQTWVPTQTSSIPLAQIIWRKYMYTWQSVIKSTHKNNNRWWTDCIQRKTLGVLSILCACIYMYSNMYTGVCQSSQVKGTTYMYACAARIHCIYACRPCMHTSTIQLCHGGMHCNPFRKTGLWIAYVQHVHAYCTYSYTCLFIK